MPFGSPKRHRDDYDVVLSDEEDALIRRIAAARGVDPEVVLQQLVREAVDDVTQNLTGHRAAPFVRAKRLN